MAISADEVNKVAGLAGLQNFTGNYSAIGGGEINDTFLLKCSDKNYILRIAKTIEQTSLIDEAQALKRLHISQAPELVFFDQNQRINDRLWIVESFMNGAAQARLSVPQYFELGKILAKVHEIKDPDRQPLDLWHHFLTNCRNFGDESKILNHPDQAINNLVTRCRNYLAANQPLFTGLQMSLIHGDATPSNILVDGENINLIDWELSRFSDPMYEFSTIYYEDMEFNQGKWRLKITDSEKQSLFSGYSAAGGQIDQKRVDFWMNFDKLGAAVFLYWRLNESKQPASDEQMSQYKLDLANLIDSLEKNLPRMES